MKTHKQRAAELAAENFILRTRLAALEQPKAIVQSMPPAPIVQSTTCMHCNGSGWIVAANGENFVCGSCCGWGWK